MNGTRMLLLGLAVAWACAGCSAQTYFERPSAAATGFVAIQSLTAASGANRTLVEKEYTIAELKQLDVSCVKVFAGRDDIVFTRAGDTLKLRYYQYSAGDYALTTERLHSGTRTYLCLTGTKSARGTGAAQTIEVTLPANHEFYRLYGGTESGGISFVGCAGDLFYANSVSGDISFRDCAANEKLTVETHSGRIDIMGLTTGGAFDGQVLSESGAVQFAPNDPVANYHCIFGTRPTNRIAINGKTYNGGAFELNQTAAKTIRFESGYFYDGDDESGRSGQGTASFAIIDSPQTGTGV